jgi:hypothetical protein
MYIHPEIEINIETVIDRFAAAQPRKSKKKGSVQSQNSRAFKVKTQTIAPVMIT